MGKCEGDLVGTTDQRTPETWHAKIERFDWVETNRLTNAAEQLTVQNTVDYPATYYNVFNNL